jgi:hypothetical protein
MGQADGFGENVQVRGLNVQCLAGRKLAVQDCTRVLRQMPSPWVMKDPRFVLTIAAWMPTFESLPPNDRPAMLFVTRSSEKVERTYIANGEVKDGVPFMYRHTVSQLTEHAHQEFIAWPYAKLHLEFEQVIEAVKIFNLKRATRRDAPAEVDVI